MKNSGKIARFINSYGVIILVTAWIIVHAFLIFIVHKSPVFHTDSLRYLKLNEQINNNFYSFSSLDSYIFYASYGLFLNVIFLLWNSLKAVVLIQHVIAFLAFYLFIKWMKLNANEKDFFIAGILFLVMIDFHMWHSYIMTESLFFSLGIILFVLIFGRQFKGRKLLISLIILFLMFLRPNFWVYFLTLMIVYFIYQFQGKGKKILSVAGFIFIAALIGSVFFINSIPSRFPVDENYKQGNVICGYQPSDQSRNSLFYEKPPESLKKQKALNSPVAIAGSFRNYPGYFLNIWIKRSVVWMTGVRPYYSNVHNVFLLMVLIPLYIVFVIKLFRNFGKIHIKTIFIYFILSMLIAAFIYPTWPGRFFLPLYPFLIIGAFSKTFPDKPEN